MTVVHHRPGALVPHPTAATLVNETNPTDAGWIHSGLEIWQLPAGGTHEWRLGQVEGLVLPLTGSVELDVTEPSSSHVRLDRGSGPFDGPADAVYLPPRSRAMLRSQEGARVALASAVSTAKRPVRLLTASEVTQEVRGAGPWTRRVTNYTVDRPDIVERLQVCEVYTPSGNVSSYPPHKHDEHTSDERPLEEIYYYELAPALPGLGIEGAHGYHRTTSSPGRPIDTLVEVRTGDIVLVPHGYHGPCLPCPGFEMYYLNVMAGPGDDARWLASDLPGLGTIRSLWRGMPADPRAARVTPSDKRRG